ncbi:uncharacterized protein [Clytia hemisphaerica]|uniref:Tyrosinase copper-binding domain-containing protein n=1 Tax=Clytia hemisphaerica TaxID=252671 RepID=A0A7M6DQE2_9CNID
MRFPCKKRSKKSRNTIMEDETTQNFRGDQNIRIRMSIRDLQEPENSVYRYAFLKAFNKIKNLPINDPDCFWNIASTNAQPFYVMRTTPAQSTKIWRGYSQHENVLFLPWYRAYLSHLEQALIRQAPPSEKQLVALPFWDSTSDESMTSGLPDLLMDDYVTIDTYDNQIPNPLLGYTLPKAISLAESDPKFAKPLGYTTRRYPFSSLRDSTNPQYETPDAKIQNHYIMQSFKNPKFYLQENVIYALNNGIEQAFKDSLEIEGYNPFSNVSSQGNQTSLEDASNKVLEALGGDVNNKQLLGGALGDIGVKEMAAFDPLFFLHMANIDRVFWLWQVKFHTDPFVITQGAGDQGIKAKYGQGPSPNQTGNENLTNLSNLYPFIQPASDPQRFVNCNDLMDIKTQLGYRYSRGSFGTTAPEEDIKQNKRNRKF